MEEETICSKIYIKKIGKSMTIELNGYHANDSYATNLNLTGSTNWFGSLNMSNLLGELSFELFPKLVIDNDDQSPFSSKSFNLLELGSGLGRAGIVAAKMMQLESCVGSCVLTDGELDIVQRLKQNCVLNGLPVEHSADSISNDVKCYCQQLWWGESEELNVLKAQYPFGFDCIIGCDLIYGPTALKNLKSLMYTINSLLSHGNGVDKNNINRSTIYDYPQPVFYFSFTRRGGISIGDLVGAAEVYNLEYEIMEDYTFDIFNNNVETDSLMWTDTIIKFKRSSVGR